jgi:hypothetical protein
LSDEQTYDQRLTAKISKDLEAFESDPVAKGQAVLDAWWQRRLDEAEERRRMMRELNPTGLKIW